MKTESVQSVAYEDEVEEAKKAEQKRLEQEFVSSIELLLETHEHKIGEGRTAEVFYPEHNHEVCFKLIRDIESYGKEIPKRYRIAKKTERPHYNHLADEGKFLAALKGAHPDVEVPTPHIAFLMERSEEGDTYWVKEKIQALLMNRLTHCATLREIIEQDLPLPKGFEVEKFLTSLRQFVSIMHSKNIYHRDLHDGNIMINLDTGKPYVIDFGASVTGSEDDAYRETEVDGSGTVYTRDEDNLDKAERVLRKHLTKRDI